MLPILSVALAAPLLLPQSAGRVFTGARLIPIAGDEIARGYLLVRDGKIAALGPMDGFVPPAGAEVVDLAGKVVMPGLVDTHSHVGGGWGADGSAPIQPDVRLLDSVDVRDPGFRRARAGGITVANVMPGSGHLLSGQTLYLKLREGSSIDDLLIADAQLGIAGGMKMANGTNSHRDPPFPGTRGKSAALVREQFVKAQAYRDKVRAAAGDPEKRPDRDLNLEALVDVLDRKRVVQHHTHRHDDILTVIRLSQEFGFDVVLHHVSEAWKVADDIAKAGVPCSAILVDSPGGKLEARDLSMETGAILERAGVLTAFHTDDWITDSRWFLRSGALAVRAGMTRKGALESLTIAGAKMLRLADRVGSLAPGKDADFVVLSGDPFSVRTQVLETWIEGAKVFDRTRPEDRLAAEGGFGAGTRNPRVGCCDGDDR